MVLSVVVPVFNEQESLENFYRQLLSDISKIKADFEIIFVDDGSTDASLEMLKRIAGTDKQVKIYSFRKRSGKAEALTLGFQKAKGDLIVTLDADLQDKPEEIKKLITKQKEGFDLVCGWRKDRKDAFKTKLSSKLFNSIASIFWGLKLHDYNCGLKLYTRDVAKFLNLYGGMHRFIPLLAHDQGFTVTEVAIEHAQRKYGVSKYGFSKIWKDLPDIFTMLFLSKYSKRPFHFFGVAGGLFVLTGVIILGYLSLLHFQNIAIGQRPLLFFGMLLVISGFQLFFTGFLADLIINIFSKRQNDFALKYSSENQ